MPLLVRTQTQDVKVHFLLSNLLFMQLAHFFKILLPTEICFMCLH